MILSCHDVTKAFGVDVILDKVSFLINEHEKTAIVGINGAGKSTLLKIIAGEMSADSGDITFAKGASFGYLAQHQELTSGKNVYDEMLSVREDVLQMEETLRKLEEDMKHVEGEALEQMLSNYTRITHEFEQEEGYSYRSRVVGVLKGLGFSEEDFTKSISTLSGGQKTRLALGRLLLQNPDLIMLDEPINHLDIESIAWLETYLLNYKGAVVIVAHDRYFMDKIVTKVVELDNNKSRTFEGNYSAYAEKKEQLRTIELQHYLNQQEEIKRQEAVIEKLKSFNREKSIKRAESREKMLAKIERIERPAVLDAEMHIHLEPCITSGNDVLSVKGLAKAFGPQQLFTDVSFEIKRGERLAILGANGTGKTTMLKIINGFLPADAGEIKPGVKVYVGYYDQEQQVLHPEKTVFEEIQDDYPTMTITEVRNTLACFLFTGDDVFKQVKELSGGERGRVSLAKLMLSEANLLILDEPTNHLDIVSKEILEKALNAYTGTVLFVSHDRYFVNKVATGILDLTHGQIVRYNGNYEYYLEKKEETESRLFAGASAAPISGTASAVAASSAANTQTTATKVDWQQQKEEQAKERKRKNEIAKIEEKISKLEAENDEIDYKLANDATLFSNYPKLTEFNNRKKAIESEIESLMEQWEALMS